MTLSQQSTLTAFAKRAQVLLHERAFACGPEHAAKVNSDLAQLRMVWMRWAEERGIPASALSF